MSSSAERYDIIQQNQSATYPQVFPTEPLTSKESSSFLTKMQPTGHTLSNHGAPFWSTSPIGGGPQVSVGGGIVSERDSTGANSTLYNYQEPAQQHNSKQTQGGQPDTHSTWQKQSTAGPVANQNRQPHILVGSHPNQTIPMPWPYQSGQGQGGFVPVPFQTPQQHQPLGSLPAYAQPPWAGVPPGTIILLQPPVPTATSGPQMPQVYSSIPQNHMTAAGMQYITSQPMDGSQVQLSPFPTAVYGNPQQQQYQQQPPQGQFIVSAPATPRTANGTSTRTSFSESGTATPLHAGETTALPPASFGMGSSAAPREVELSLRPVHLRSTDPSALTRPPWDSPNARLLSSQDVCKEHLSRGCRHGSRCQYLHLPDTWRPFPDQICRDFLRGGAGACGRSKCRFFHGFTSELTEATAYLQSAGIPSQRVFVFHADGGPEPSHPLQDQLFLLYKK